MSRAFAKEDDAVEAPIIPARAALPPGVTNYVTPQGLAQLRAEAEELETERTKLETSQGEALERTRQLTIIKGKIKQLNDRLATAKLVETQGQPADQIRFGATVILKTTEGGKPGFVRKFTIVGVDEASITDGKIAFVAPIAKAVQGARKGDVVTLQVGGKEEKVLVEEIAYT
ncbi:GreA/GreB family elongation factor [Rufibacter sp. DG15C]|uniref:GreA/GreB family elongation factor n=1 Tax=Rufibacter sp. DG15C TaxID=1379909 RepID=UPI00078EC108|nr:GreA/GreB family elongation factor [Rufibacter sp. DG15C]AMM52175.1 GreA/GreB family elongation factor [Rufibacter sp. DG15C]